MEPQSQAEITRSPVEGRFVQDRITTLRRGLAPGIVSGLIAGAVLDAYLIVSVVFIAHAAGLVSLYQFIASGLVGKAAYSDPSYVVLGIAVHFAASALWGVGYAYAAQGMRQLRDRPFISGLGYGLIVFVFMQLMEVASGIFAFPHSAALFNELLAHALFFGVPLAYLVRARTNAT